MPRAIDRKQGLDFSVLSPTFGTVPFASALCGWALITAEARNSLPFLNSSGQRDTPLIIIEADNNFVRINRRQGTN